jgi:hypothetical protein
MNYYADSVGGLDTNPGSALLPFKTAQKCADTAVAGDTVYGTGTEILAAIIDFDTNTGSVANGRIKFVSCNSAFLPTKHEWIWDADSAVASIVKMYTGKSFIEFSGIYHKNSTSHAVTNATAAYSFGNSWLFCKFENITGQAFSTSYLQGFKIKGCEFINITGAIISSLYQGMFTDNRIINCAAAIACIITYSVAVVGNVFCNCNVAIDYTNTIASNYVKNNVFHQCTVGIDCSYTTSGIVAIAENRFTACSIAGIRTNAAGEWCYESYNYFANNAADLVQSAGNAIFSEGGSVYGGTENGYVNSAIYDFTLLPNAIMRRVLNLTEGRYITAGIPGADIYPQDFYLDKSVVSVTAGTVLTITLKHLAATLITGLKINGIACTDLTATGASTATVATPTLTAGTFDVTISLTGYDDFVITKGMTAQEPVSGGVRRTLLGAF